MVVSHHVRLSRNWQSLVDYVVQALNVSSPNYGLCNFLSFDNVFQTLYVSDSVHHYHVRVPPVIVLACAGVAGHLVGDGHQ